MTTIWNTLPQWQSLHTLVPGPSTCGQEEVATEPPWMSGASLCSHAGACPLYVTMAECWHASTGSVLLSKAPQWCWPSTYLWAWKRHMSHSQTLSGKHSLKEIKGPFASPGPADGHDEWRERFDLPAPLRWTASTSNNPIHSVYCALLSRPLPDRHLFTVWGRGSRNDKSSAMVSWQYTSL